MSGTTKLYEFISLSSAPLTKIEDPEVCRTEPVVETTSSGGSVFLPCRVSVNAHVQWRLRHSGKVIVNDSRFAGPFKSRFSFGESVETYHDLNIRDCRQSDAGVYECIENNGKGRSHFVVLIVTGMDTN